MTTEELLKLYYSDPKYDGTTRFYEWIRESVTPASRVLNMGAGPPTENPIRIFKGEAAEIVGADVHPVIFKNNELDRAVLIENGVVPLESEIFDIVYSDYVLEHVEHPEQFLREVARVLKPGGSFLFRTPNVYHYTAIVAGLTPHWFHQAVSKKARALDEDAQEPWPTFYRMNRVGKLKRLAPPCGFQKLEFRMVEAQPSYLMFHPLAFYVGLGYERLLNSSEVFAGLRVNIQGRFTK